MAVETKTILITCASSGIGAELAVLYAANGLNVGLFARRGSKLQEIKERCLKAVAGAQIECIIGDVKEREHLDKAVRQLKEKFGRLDVVIANAGYVVTGKLSELSIDDYRRQFDTNVFGVLNTVYSTLDLLKETKGSLVLMGSVNSYIPVSGFSAYCMSKAAIKALADCLYKELKVEKISVTLLCPGVVDSEIYKVDNKGKFHDDWKDRRPAELKVNVKKAAMEIKKAIDSRRREAVITGHGKVLVWLQRHVPVAMSQIVKLFTARQPSRRI